VLWRNAEDLGVEIFSPSPVFELTMPIITPHWDLTLHPGEESPCMYDIPDYRYCAPLKTAIHTSGLSDVELRPAMVFTVKAHCEAEVCPPSEVRVFEYSTAGVGKAVATLPVKWGASTMGRVAGTTTGAYMGANSAWVVATVRNTWSGELPAVLYDVTQEVTYNSDGHVYQGKTHH